MLPALVLLVLAIFEGVQGDCGCLKCSKGLTVISPPSSPLKIIMRGKPKAKAARFPNYANPYALAPTPSMYQTLYGAQLQIPYIPPPPTPLITSLAATPDRIVIPAPEVPSPVGCPFSSSGPIMETVAIPPPYDDRATMNVQEMPFYPPQYAYPPPQALAPSCCPCQGYASDFVMGPRSREGRARTKRGLTPHHYRSYRPPLHQHNPLGLLRSPFHFFLRTIPKLLAFPIVQFLRMLTGYQGDPLLSRRSGDLLESRRYPDFEARSRPLNRMPPRSILISKLRKINELTSDYRKKRSIAFHTDEESVPFFKVSEVDGDGGGDDEDDDAIVGSEFLKPLHFKQMFPHKPLFYLLNTPIRILSHLDSLKNHIRPVVSSIPLVLQNSKKYLMDFGRQFHNHLLDFASNMIGDFDHAPHFRPLRPLVPRKRYQRSLSTFAQFLQTTTSVANKSADDSFETSYNLEHDDLGYNRTKRYILKMVDEKEVEEFLKEKLGDDAPVVGNKKTEKNLVAGAGKRLIIEPLAPKIIIDRKGKTFFEMNGLKRPFFTKRKSKHHQNRQDSDDISWQISNLIEQAKATPQIVGSTYDSSMYLQIVREKITETLNDIETLINTDFTKHTNLYEDLRHLQNLKTVTVNEWKQLLITNKINDMVEKIKILNSFQQLQEARGGILKKIVQMLDGRSFMAPRLIKLLVRLQKLQCVVYSVVEDFGERLKTRTQFDPQREIRYVEYLDGINFVAGKTRQELEAYLRRERDVELQRRIKLLERLRELLEVEEVGKINEEARLLWEMRNIEKLQRESIRELNLKIEGGQKVRKELKILFDLQRQLEVAERRQEEILVEERGDIVGKARQKPKRAKLARA